MPVFANRVNAQTETPEYQPTYIPIYNTPTPPGYISYDCPGYQPLGYGVVTPSWEWWLNCGQCITPGSGYAFPTFVIPTLDPTLGFNTSTPPAATRTPIPTDTPTPTPDPNDVSNNTTINQFTQGNLEAEVFYSFSEYNKGYSTSLINYQNAYIRNSSPGNFKLNFTHTYNIHISSWGNSSYYTTITLTLSCNYADTCIFEFLPGEYDNGFNKGNTVTLSRNGTQALVVKTLQQPADFVLDGFYEINITVLGGDNTTNSKVGLGLSRNNILASDIDWEYNYYWIKSHYISITPTPTPIPGYCSIIEEEGTGGDDDDDFTIPGIVVGDATCLTLGGWTIPLEWLENIFPGSFSDWTMQGIQFCFAPLEFGDLTIFGVNIDLDFIAAAMAGILLIRVLTRS